jgi:hypothetical protein
MNNRTHGITSIISSAALLLAFGVTASAGIVTARFDPPTRIVQLGDTFTVDLVADLGSPVIGWGLDLATTSVGASDPAVLTIIAPPTIGSSWMAPPYNPDGDGVAGLGFPAGISGNNVLLATLHYRADAPGEMDLLLSITPGDNTEGFALYPTGFATPTFNAGHVTILPEPASLAFLAILLPLARRRRS